MNTPELPGSDQTTTTRNRSGIKKVTRLPQALFSRLFHLQAPIVQSTLDTIRLEGVKQSITAAIPKSTELLHKEQTTPKNLKKSREERMAEYGAWRESRRQQPIAGNNKQTVKPLVQLTAERISQPENQRSDKISGVTPREIPWIVETEQISLSIIRLVGGSVEFYYGDFIRGDRLLNARKKVEKNQRLPALERLLLRRLEGWFQNSQDVYIRALEKPVTEKTEKRIPIFKAGNSNGERVYFMRLDNIEGIPVIIRIAVCADATSENNDVMPVLSYEQRRKS